MSRDVKNKRRKSKVKSLIEAYRKLDNISHREKFDPKDFESAIADIQLYSVFVITAYELRGKPLKAYRYRRRKKK